MTDFITEIWHPFNWNRIIYNKILEVQFRSWAWKKWRLCLFHGSVCMYWFVTGSNELANRVRACPVTGVSQVTDAGKLEHQKLCVYYWNVLIETFVMNKLRWRIIIIELDSLLSSETLSWVLNWNEKWFSFSRVKARLLLLGYTYF